MNKVDYIIVGCGLAGLSFARQLEMKSKSFVVFENNSQQSSKVAGGMYNPVILKRFTPVWDAEQQLINALPFYKDLEKLLEGQYDTKIDTHRLFTSIEEQNNWFAKCDHPLLSEYMIPKVIDKKYRGVISNFGYGKVSKTGKINTKLLLEDYSKYLSSKQMLKLESFDYNQIHFKSEFVTYKDVTANRIVFCEGFGVRNNPFFKELPMNEAKGELITIHAPELEIDFVLKSAVFIMPLGDHLFKVGATFNWKDKTHEVSDEGKKELIDKLKKIINVPFKIVDHVAGIRPATKDRRPFIGIHKELPQLAILNGLGTRGVMIAPTVSKELVDFLENGTPLRKEIDIARFEN